MCKTVSVLVQNGASCALSIWFLSSLQDGSCEKHTRALAWTAWLEESYTVTCAACSLTLAKKQRWTFTSNRSLQKFHLIDGLVGLSSVLQQVSESWKCIIMSKLRSKSMGKKLHCARAASKQEDLSDTWIQGISFRRWDFLVYIIGINMLYIYYLYIQLMYMIYINNVFLQICYDLLHVYWSWQTF